jgi:hypothetical protein
MESLYDFSANQILHVHLRKELTGEPLGFERASDQRTRRLRIVGRNVKRFNSVGIRAWAHAMKSLNCQASKIIFAECSPALVDAFVLFPGLLGTGIIESLFVSFYCERCARTTEVLVYVGWRPERLETHSCAHCGAADAKLEADPDGLFRLLSTNSRGGSMPTKP